MTTVQSPPAPPTAIRPRVVARTGLYAVLAANATVVTWFFVQAGFASNALIMLGRLAGLYAALLMAFQLLLVARLPWLDRRIGMDRLTSWHRWTGFGLLWTLVAHVVFISFGYAECSDVDPLGQIVDLAETIEGVLRAVVALGLILVIGGGLGPLRPAPAGLRDLALHPPVHLRRGGAGLHAPGRGGTTFTASSAATAYWYGVWGVALGSVFLGRLVLPLWRNWRHQLRVAAVVPEADNVVSVYITGRDLDQLPARAGQFFLWRFLTRDRWWQANPFSLSAAPDGTGCG